MDLNPPSPSNQQTPHHNAVAGPSSIPLNSSLFILLPASPRPSHLLESTQDLISRFHLLSAYDKFVRPFISQEHDPHSAHFPTTPAVPPSSDKRKGKERDPGSPTIASAATPGTHHDPDDEEGRDGKKKKNTYRHLIKGIPGKHSIKKDDFLTTIVQVPPKQHIPIAPFDLRTQSDAFTVSLEGLKGWNIHALVPESTQAREDRKKRKELKKLAKVQGSTLPPSASTPLPSTPATASTPTQPHSQPQRTSTPVPVPRGVKREFEDSALAQSNTQGPSSAALSSGGNVSPTTGRVDRTGSAKAGVPGARPRPVKRQRVDIQGQGRDMHPLPPIQQPTPQGV
ncbi:hypothetical protein F5148DRAFT_523846 [Russula earlei]|uniref:Uncharacterized protein n=1 Tax=Russula earlei TaxID=71964 RepID=A0ACC0UG82_9AGAM|nr:hypothetical protein F5148DRAFT_523846 [Russula earlei]